MRLLLGIVIVLVLTSCGGDSDKSLDARDRAVVWCDLEIGDARENVLEAMGAPGNDGPDFASWTDGEFTFSASFDVDGSARQLILEGVSTDAEREGLLTCDPSRIKQ